MNSAEEITRFRERHTPVPPPADSRENEMRLRILDVAVEIAAAEGVRGASLRRISSALEMRTATLYSFFPEGKDQIMSESIQNLLESYYRRAARTLRPNDSSLENLRSLVFTHVQWVLEKPTTVSAWDVILAADRISPVLMDTVREHIQDISAGYRRILKSLLMDLDVPEDASASYAELIPALCDATAKWTQPNPSLAEPLQAAEFAWMAIRNMVLSAPMERYSLGVATGHQL